MDDDLIRENVTEIQHTVDKLYTALTVRTVHIGSHRFEPSEKIIISSKGIRIIAPNTKPPHENCVLDIQKREVVKLICHFSKVLNVMFMYTLHSCGEYIRESLEMGSSSDSFPYYNPISDQECNKKIVLLMDTISDDSKSVIRSVYSVAVLEEITARDASEMLSRAIAKNAPKTRASVKNEMSVLVKDESTENIRQILIYPPGKGGISINTEDYMCLAIDQYLNDVIIDFFLLYLLNDVLHADERARTHVFSTFFYKRLTTMTTRQRQTEKDQKMSASQKRHARVKNWTKSVNLFEKDYIIIPINEQSHWFLAIICFPALKGPVTYDGGVPVKPLPPHRKRAEKKRVPLQIGSTTITPVLKREVESICLGDESERDEAEGDDSDLASDDSDMETEPPAVTPIKQPCILIFDSLAGASRSRVVATLRDYLTCEYKAKIHDSSAHVFTKLNIPGHSVKVPQQNNFTDCGLFLLQYVEQFFQAPIKDYRLPIKHLTEWFDTMRVTRKREEISDLLNDLVRQHNPEQLPLPDITFPTLNGKLIDPDDSFTEDHDDFEEEELEEDIDDINDELYNTGGETESESSSPEKNVKIEVVSSSKPVTSGTVGASTSTIPSASAAATAVATTTTSNGATRPLFKRNLDCRNIAQIRKMPRFDDLKKN